MEQLSSSGINLINRSNPNNQGRGHQNTTSLGFKTIEEFVPRREWEHEHK
jgi:hypothetical protein